MQSPYGTSVVLGAGGGVTTSPYWVGDDGSSLYNTIFDDEASSSIYEGTPPFVGSFSPDELLSAFDGESMIGDWNLVLYSEEPHDITIDWSLEIESELFNASDPPNFGVKL